MMARKRLGEMLLEARLIDDDGLRAALSEQKRWGGPLGRFFIELGLVSEENLVQMLSRQLNMPIVDVSKLSVPQAVLDLVPGEFANANGVIPFAQPMKFLDVAMIDPTNQSTIDSLRVMTQLNVRPHLCGPRALEKAIVRLYNIGVSAARLTSNAGNPFAAGQAAQAWSDAFPAEETSSFEVMHTDGSRSKASRQGAQRLESSAGSAGLAEPVLQRKPPRTRQPSAINEIDIELSQVPPIGAPPARTPVAPPPSPRVSTTVPPPHPTAGPSSAQMAGIDDMLGRLNLAVHQLAAQINDLHAKQERDESVLRKLLAILVEKGVCTREELQAWLAEQ